MSELCAMLLTFNFQFSLLFFHVGPPGSRVAYWFMQYQTSDIARNLGTYLSCTWCKVQGNDFELILAVKLETSF